MSTIVPTEKITTEIVVRFEMYIQDLVLNTSATFRVVSFDIENKPIDTVYVLLSGEDYTNWGNNDEYVIQFVATQLGFTLV